MFRRSLLLLIANAIAVQGANAVAAQPAIAKNAGDVIGTTAGSYMMVGSVGFVFSAASAAVRRVPAPIRVGMGAANRWGKITAGFAGGRAAGQVVRRKDDIVCSMAGAFFGGLGAAASLAEAPQSIVTFMAFSYVLDTWMAPPSNSPPQPGQEEKIAWKGRSLDEVRAEAEARARANYKRRHSGDETRLKALAS